MVRFAEASVDLSLGRVSEFFGEVDRVNSRLKKISDVPFTMKFRLENELRQLAQAEQSAKEIAKSVERISQMNEKAAASAMKFRDAMELTNKAMAEAEAKAASKRAAAAEAGGIVASRIRAEADLRAAAVAEAEDKAKSKRAASVEAGGNFLARVRAGGRMGMAMIQASYGVQDLVTVMGAGGSFQQGMVAMSNNLGAMMTMMGGVHGAAAGLAITLAALAAPKVITWIEEVVHGTTKWAGSLERVNLMLGRMGQDLSAVEGRADFAAKMRPGAGLSHDSRQSGMREREDEISKIDKVNALREKQIHDLEGKLAFARGATVFKENPYGTTGFGKAAEGFWRGLRGIGFDVDDPRYKKLKPGMRGYMDEDAQRTAQQHLDAMKKAQSDDTARRGEASEEHSRLAVAAKLIDKRDSEKYRTHVNAAIAEIERKKNSSDISEREGAGHGYRNFRAGLQSRLSELKNEINDSGKIFMEEKGTRDEIVEARHKYEQAIAERARIQEALRDTEKAAAKETEESNRKIVGTFERRLHDERGDDNEYQRRRDAANRRHQEFSDDLFNSNLSERDKAALSGRGRSANLKERAKIDADERQAQSRFMRGMEAAQKGTGSVMAIQDKLNENLKMADKLYADDPEARTKAKKQALKTFEAERMEIERSNRPKGGQFFGIEDYSRHLMSGLASGDDNQKQIAANTLDAAQAAKLTDDKIQRILDDGIKVKDLPVLGAKGG